MTRTIVIIHLGALGDVLLAVPAMKRLRMRFPHHKLIGCTTEPVGRLLRDCRVIDVWISLQESSCAEIFGGSVPASGELKQWLERCDLAVGWLQDPEGTLASTLRCCGANATAVRSPFSKQLRSEHQGDRFLETIGETPAVASLGMHLRIPGHLLEKGRAHLERVGTPTGRPLALVHPGSGSRHKCVNPEALASVVERLQDDGIHPLLIEGPADEETASGLLKMIPVKPKVLRGLSLSVLAGVVAQSELYIGHDSGLTHLSGLIGIPTVALFGPTSSERWAPRGRHVTLLRGAPCSCRSWEAVRSCAEKPCLAIPVEEILRASRIHRLIVPNPRNTAQCALSPPIP